MSILASKITKNPQKDSTATDLLKTAKVNLEYMRIQFNDILKKTKIISRKWNIGTSLQNKKIRTVIFFL